MASPEARPPYVVSADGFELMHRWAEKAGYKLPSEAYFRDYTMALETALTEATGVDVEVINHTELKYGLELLTSQSAYPVISLDRAYLNGSPNVVGHIDITRAVDPELNDVGLYHRPGTPSLHEQLEQFRTSEPSAVILADDVIFTGESIVKLAQRLKYVGRPVVGVIAGIGVKGGVDTIEAAGIETTCVRSYNSVTDEVCQRDFLAAIPYSGRTVVDKNSDYHTLWSAPYLKPFGDPEKWASIPSDRVKEFSKFCLEHSISLWREVSDHSGIDIPVLAVPRPLRGMDGRRELVTEFLGKHLDICELITVGEGD